MKILSLISLLFLSFFIFSCEREEPEPPRPDENWQSLGLDNTRVQKIFFSDNFMYAATTNGVFRNNLNNLTANGWQSLGLESKDVLDLVIYNDQEILAAIELGPEEDISLYRSTDGGQNWSPYQQGFGGEEPATVNAFAQDPNNPDIILARGNYVVAKSPNRGQSWELLFGEWGMAGYQAPLIKIDENNPEYVWAGGENSLFQPYLLRSTDGGETWLGVDPPYEGDDAVYSLVSHSENPDHILIGMEGQIRSSNDGGLNWDTSITFDDGTYITRMKKTNSQEETIFATGSQNGTSGGNLFFYESHDFGQNWELNEFEEGNGSFYISDLKVHRNEGETVLYFATDQGVYQYIRR